MESLIAFRRVGADAALSRFGPRAAERLREGRYGERQNKSRAKLRDAAPFPR